MANCVVQDAYPWIVRGALEGCWQVAGQSPSAPMISRQLSRVVHAAASGKADQTLGSPHRTDGALCQKFPNGSGVDLDKKRLGAAAHKPLFFFWDLAPHRRRISNHLHCSATRNSSHVRGDPGHDYSDLKPSRGGRCRSANSRLHRGICGDTQESIPIRYES